MTFDLLIETNMEKWRDVKGWYGADRELEIEAFKYHMRFYRFYFEKEENTGTSFQF